MPNDHNYSIWPDLKQIGLKLIGLNLGNLVLRYRQTPGNSVILQDLSLILQASYGITSGPLQGGSEAITSEYDYPWQGDALRISFRHWRLQERHQGARKDFPLSK